MPLAAGQDCQETRCHAGIKARRAATGKVPRAASNAWLPRQSSSPHRIRINMLARKRSRQALYSAVAGVPSRWRRRPRPTMARCRSASKWNASALARSSEESKPRNRAMAAGLQIRRVRHTCTSPSPSRHPAWGDCHVFVFSFNACVARVTSNGLCADDTHAIVRWQQSERFACGMADRAIDALRELLRASRRLPALGAVNRARYRGLGPSASIPGAAVRVAIDE